MTARSILDIVHLIRECGPESLEIINSKIIEVDKTLTMLYRIRRFLLEDEVCRSVRELAAVAPDVKRLKPLSEATAEKAIREASRPRLKVRGGIVLKLHEHLRTFGATPLAQIVRHFTELGYAESTVKVTLMSKPNGFGRDDQGRYFSPETAEGAA